MRDLPVERDPRDPSERRRPGRDRPKASPRQRLLQPILIGLLIGLLATIGWEMTNGKDTSIPGVPNGAQKVTISQLLTRVNTDLTNGAHVQLVVYPDRVVVTAPNGALWAQKYDSTSIWDLVPRDRVLAGQLSIDEQKALPQGGFARAAAISGALFSVLLMVILGAFMVFLTWYLAKSMPRTGMKRRARSPRPARFADVAGLTAVRDDLEEVVRFLQDPDTFTKMGARCPRGVLLVGPPGTGKTLLARAVAGEANASFHAASGSDFVEMFVGMGARRVRELFAEARKKQPSIIFIDEIDAVGRRRSGQSAGGQSEYEQTINQLLTEMDGFGGSESIVIIAATNRMDVLDPALLRPGRFDRHIHVDLPDRQAREEILAVHARGKRFAPNVSLVDLSRETSGMSGADLENILNEAALAAVRASHEVIERDDIAGAIERVAMGLGTVRRLNDEERRRVAIHELGHAFVAAEFPVLGRVEKVSIVSRGGAGGFTRVSSDEDRRLLTRSLLDARLAFILGGMAAEALYCPDISSGAHGDLQMATATATAMVCDFGMSEVVGPMQLEEGAGRQVSEEVRHEVRELTNAGLQRARAILTSYAAAYQSLIERLLREEIWDGDTFEALVAGAVRTPVALPQAAAPAALPNASLAKAARPARRSGPSQHRRERRGRAAHVAAE